MNIVSFLKNVTEKLNEKKIPFALAGGLVASFYRSQPRATQDIDILIMTPDNVVKSDAQKIAENIIHEFQLTPHPLRKADLEGGPLFAIKNKSTPTFIVSGLPQKKETQIGLDIILPTMPWANDAMARAQNNKIDFGFGPIPCLTVEDIILSKFYALKNQSSRFMDLDDLKSIFETNKNIDLQYLLQQIKDLELIIPFAIQDFVPVQLKPPKKKNKKK